MPNPETARPAQGHTPGPWTYRAAYANNEPTRFVIFSDVPLSQRWGAAAHAEVATEPDARLLASAPELLEALEAIRADIQGFLNDEWEGEDGFIALTARACSAIRKATGGADA